MILLAILFPPLAVLILGKPFQSIINLILCLCFYIPGMIHAILLIQQKKEEKILKQTQMMQERMHQQTLAVLAVTRAQPPALPNK